MTISLSIHPVMCLICFSTSLKRSDLIGHSGKKSDCHNTVEIFFPLLVSLAVEKEVELDIPLFSDLCRWSLLIHEASFSMQLYKGNSGLWDVLRFLILVETSPR